MQGRHRNVKKLIGLQKKLKITYDSTITLKDTVLQIKNTFGDRKIIKQLGESLGLKFLHRLVQVKEDAGEMDAAVYLCSRNRIEEQGRIFRNIHTMENKLRGGATSLIHVIDDNGNIKELTSKSEIEKVIARSNERKYHH